MSGQSGNSRGNAGQGTSFRQKNRSARKPSSGWGELRLDRTGVGEIDHEVVNAPEDWTAAWQRLRARHPSVTDFAPYLVPNPVVRNQLLNPGWRAATEADVRSYLKEELRSSLSNSDYEHFLQHGLAGPDDRLRGRICRAIDEFIFQSAVQYGPEIFLLPEVLQRVSDWVRKENGGNERCERLGKRFALLARVRRGTAKTPLNPWWVQSRRAIIREVRILKKYLAAKLTKHRTLSKEQLLDAILDTMEDDASKFPKLLRIGAAFLAFLQLETEHLRTLLEGGITPADFVGELIQSVTNYKPESARQIISRALSRLRSLKGSP